MVTLMLLLDFRPGITFILPILLSLTCASTLKRDVHMGDEGSQDCPSFCPLVWNPVCGSDSKTYDNACHLQAASCYKSKDLTLKYEGVCREKYPNEASCLLWKHCTDHTKTLKVCGSNGKAYLNECHMMKESCRLNMTIYQIPCAKIDPKLKDVLVPPQRVFSDNSFSTYLQVSPSSTASKRHPKLAEVSSDINDRCLKELTCSKLYLPVCGSDGNTYNNECILQGVSRCKRQNTLVKAFTGDCQIEDKNISESCTSFDVSQCPDIQDAVCGDDGRTYKNECVMMGSSCSKGFLIAKRHDGPCKGSQRQKKQIFNRRKNCPFACNLIYKPVCGSDGQTYANQCQFESKNCLTSSRLLVIVAEGPCSDPTFEFESAVSEEDPNQECPKFCTFEFMPVCGLDGITYSNMCHLRFEACQNDTNIEVDHPGTCGDPFEAVVSEEEEEEFGENSPCPVYCTFSYDEVCGTDDVTYRNMCHLKYQSCLYPEDGIKKAYSGPCTQENKLKNSLDTCPTDCPNDYNPICGSDGSTYVNKCRLNLKNCIFPDQPIIGISYYGSCLEDCPEYCPTKYEPVCGSDRVTYINECNLIATNCREKSKYIFMLDTGECNSARKSDIYEQRSIDIHAISSLGPGCDTKEVCGSDGNTYSSFCDIIDANRGRKVKIFRVYDGKCNCPEVCSFDWDPVCGSDGITYPNLCAFQVKICSLQKEKRAFPNLFVQMTGEGCENLLTSKSSEQKAMEGCMKGGPEFCSTDYDPVCGSDGKSYANVCQMKKQGCISGNVDIEVYHFGLCYCTKRNTHCSYSFDKPFCGLETGEYYENLCDLEFKICENIAATSSPSTFPLVEPSANESCTMPEENDYSLCELMACDSWPLSPVCASNGRSYANECYFKKHKCFQIMRNEDRMNNDLSPQEFANFKDLKLLKRGICNEGTAYTSILRDDYYNDENGSFMDERLSRYLMDLILQLKEKKAVDRLELIHLFDIRQKNSELVTDAVMKVCNVSNCESIRCKIIQGNLEMKFLINEECIPFEFDKMDHPSEVNVTQSSCSKDGRYYYPNDEVLKSLSKNSLGILHNSSKRCCPQCSISVEDEEEMVCGSNGMSYMSKCQLRRYICLQESKGRQVFFLHNGPCKGENDIIGNIPTNKTSRVDSKIKQILHQHISKNYPRWTLRGLQLDGPKTFVLLLLEKLCFNQNRRSSTRKHCRSSLYGQRKMVCHIGVQGTRVVQESCQIPGIEASLSDVHKAATVAVELISKEFNDTSPWITTSVGKTEVESAQRGSRELMGVYLTMTRTENCEKSHCKAQNSSPVNFCDVQVEKSSSGFQLLNKICAGYKVEQFFRQS